MLIIGFALVAIPAAIGLITSAVSVTTLADRSEQAVYGAMVETRAGRRLAEAITVLERNARQFAILDDRELLGTYRQNRRLLAEALRELDAGEQVKSLVASVASIEDGIYVALSEPATTSAARRAAIERFAALHELAESVAQAGAQRIDSEVESLRTTARKVRRMAFSQLLALLPVIAFLVVGFTVLIARPIRDLDRAIRQLGRGHLSEPVRIDGPDDLAELGQRLDWMRRELIGLEQDKNHFLREIAHALKTP
ncbi:MAG: HAMP domain-containing protein [Rhodocyclaceae bacterium]|nr:HAMP domain-containing protein [Rhodocyclaceae bacterium]